MTRAPAEATALGGSLQASAMRSWPRSTTRVEPTVRVLSESTVKVCSMTVRVLLMDCSDVPSSS